MNTIKEKIQSEIKKCAEESHALLLQILALKWGSLENARQAGELRTIRDPNGAAVRRADRKKLRHPETGSQRSKLWDDKRGLKHRSRHLLLAYAYLRGRVYASQEAKTTSTPDFDVFAAIIEEAGGASPNFDTFQAWIQGAGAQASVAA